MARSKKNVVQHILPAESISPELQRLSNLIGDFIQYWGFKKIHGQIWAHIYLSDHPLDASTLVKRLKVSKALVSLAVKDLIRFDVIRVASKGSKRTVFFESNPQLYTVITKVLRSREQKMLWQIKNAVRDISENQATLDGVNAANFKNLESMIASAAGFLDLLVATELGFSAAPKNKSP